MPASPLHCHDENEPNSLPQPDPIPNRVLPGSSPTLCVSLHRPRAAYPFASIDQNEPNAHPHATPHHACRYEANFPEIPRHTAFDAIEANWPLDNTAPCSAMGNVLEQTHFHPVPTCPCPLIARTDPPGMSTHRNTPNAQNDAHWNQPAASFDPESEQTEAVGRLASRVALPDPPLARLSLPAGTPHKRNEATLPHNSEQNEANCRPALVRSEAVRAGGTSRVAAIH